MGFSAVAEQPIVQLPLLEENQFAVGLGVWDVPRSGQFVEIASGDSGIVTGLLKGEHLLVRGHQPFQPVQPFKYKIIVHWFPFFRVTK